MRFLGTLLFFFSTLALAQAPMQKIRPATDTDFPGYWRVVLTPDELHKQVPNEAMGFSEPCQLVIHQSDGTWRKMSIASGAGDDETKRQCPPSRSLIDQILLTQAASPFRWSKQPNQDGYFFVRNISITDPTAVAAHLWKADYVAEDFPSAGFLGFDLKKGEMLMQLTKPLGNNRFVPVWSMVLRPILE